MTRTTTSKKLWVIAAAASVLLWSCGGSNGGAMSGMDHGGTTTQTDGATPAVEASCSPDGAALAVSADASKFDTACLAAPAGQPFTIAFDNAEPVVHNVAILKSHSSNEVLFRGELFRGPETMTYEVPALEAGTYVFHCETHQGAMRGSLVVA